MKPVSENTLGIHPSIGVSTIQVGQGQPPQYEVMKTLPSMSAPSPTYIAVPSSTASMQLHSSQMYNQYNGQNYSTYTNSNNGQNISTQSMSGMMCTIFYLNVKNFVLEF